MFCFVLEAHWPAIKLDMLKLRRWILSKMFSEALNVEYRVENRRGDRLEDSAGKAFDTSTRVRIFLASRQLAGLARTRVSTTTSPFPHRTRWTREESVGVIDIVFGDTRTGQRAV